MLREHNKIVIRIHKTLDLILVALAFITAYQVKRNVIPGTVGGLSTEPNYYLILLLSLIIAIFSFRYAGFYQSYRRQKFYQISIRIIKAVLGILLGVIASLYVLHEQGVSRLLLLLFAGFLTSLLFLTKGLVYYTLRYYRSRDYNTLNVLIVGTGERTQRIVTALRRESGSGYKIVGFLDTLNGQNRRKNDTAYNPIVLGSLSN